MSLHDDVYREALHDWLDERDLERDPAAPSDYLEDPVLDAAIDRADIEKDEL